MHAALSRTLRPASKVLIPAPDGRPTMALHQASTTPGMSIDTHTPRYEAPLLTSVHWATGLNHSTAAARSQTIGDRNWPRQADHRATYLRPAASPAPVLRCSRKEALESAVSMFSRLACSAREASRYLQSRMQRRSRPHSGAHCAERSGRKKSHFSCVFAALCLGTSLAHAPAFNLLRFQAMDQFSLSK